MKYVLWISIAIAALIAGCKFEQVQTPVEPTPTPAPVKYVLQWENSHPERSVWSEILVSRIKSVKDNLDQAKDLAIICPKYHSMTEAEQVKVLSEFWVSVAYYESGWNPKSQSVDVGTKSDHDTWSIGLWQMSVVDQPNYGLKYGYDFDKLLEVDANAHLSLSILSRQAMKKGKLILVKGQDSGVYWAVIYKGGTYDRSSKIIAMTQKAVPSCNP